MLHRDSPASENHPALPPISRIDVGGLSYPQPTTETTSSSLKLTKTTHTSTWQQGSDMPLSDTGSTQVPKSPCYGGSRTGTSRTATCTCIRANSSNGSSRDIPSYSPQIQETSHVWTTNRVVYPMHRLRCQAWWPLCQQDIRCTSQFPALGAH